MISRDPLPADFCIEPEICEALPGGGFVAYALAKGGRRHWLVEMTFQAWLERAPRRLFRRVVQTTRWGIDYVLYSPDGDPPDSATELFDPSEAGKQDVARGELRWRGSTLQLEWLSGPELAVAKLNMQ
jgi:hypothetical protein